jgi:radical SAM protein with 4Fe4S-binding SPASM domain
MTIFGKVKRYIQGVNEISWNISDRTKSIHHYAINDNGASTRVHLRLEQDGSGVLLVNANSIFHLNQSAAEMAFFSLEKTPENQVLNALGSRYHASKEQLRMDYSGFQEQLQGLIHPNGGCPICDYEVEATTPFSHNPSAPYRMDLALTYRCNNNCSHCYNDPNRDRLELNTQSWEQILEKLWDDRIPHIVFTGGEPTLRNDLPALIHKAESQGQITGLNTNGRRLKQPSYVEELVSSGLDHIQITLESHLESIHDQMVERKGAWQDTTQGIANALKNKLFVMTNTTLLKENSIYLRDTLEFLGEMGVPTVGLNALIYSGSGRYVGTGLSESELPSLLEIARDITDHYHQRLIWYTPTQYCHFDPVQMQLGIKGCTAALYNMCIEPDGSVIPCQSYYQSLGNILEDDWQSIWNHPLASQLRSRALAPQKCRSCTFLAECGGGCPLSINEKQPEPARFASEILY